MRLGALLGPVTKGAEVNTLSDQARRYTGEGFDSLWASHTVGRGFMLTDPLLALTVAATAAGDVEVGTAILQLPLYHPMELAHRVLSLHQICGDRLVLGVGAGSTETDFNTFGRDYTTRFSDFNRALEVLHETYQTGTDPHQSLTPWPGMTLPKLFYGTWGKGVARAASEFNGWIASAHYRTPSELEEAHRAYRAAGGSRAIVSTIVVDKETDLGDLKKRLARLEEIGFDDAVVMLYPGAPAPAEVRKLV